MRCLVLCNKVPFPPRDGSSVAIASNVRGLERAGVTVDVVALNTVKHRVRRPRAEGLGPAVTLDSVDADTTPTPIGAAANLLRGSSYLVSRFDQRAMHRRLDALLATRDYDLAVIEGLSMMHYAERLRAAGARVVLRAHNVEHQIWERVARQEPNPLKRCYLREQARRLARFEEAAARRVDLIAAISEEDAAWFAHRSEHVHVMPCGHEVAPLNGAGYGPSDAYHLGSMDWIPNIDGVRWFLKAVWPKVRAQDAGAMFHLAGRQSDDLVDRNGIPGVCVHGEVDDAAAFLRDRGILVVPLRSGSGTRIKIIEAMAHGKPIVSTAIGAEGIPLTSGRDAMLVDDEAGFARALVDLMRSPEKRHALGTSAWRLARERFDESAIAGRFLAALESGR